MTAGYAASKLKSISLEYAGHYSTLLYILVLSSNRQKYWTLE